MVSSGGVPYMAVLGSTVVGFLTILLNYFAPEKIFSFLLATSGAISLWLTWLVIVFIAGCLIYMTYLPAHRAEMLSTAALTVAIIAISFVSRSRRLQR